MDSNGNGVLRNILRILQLSLFQVGSGFVSILVLGILNRVMFTEIGLSPALIGFLLAIPPLLSPLRLWIGYLSDSRPLFGLRRFPYILAGIVLSAAGVLGGTASTLNIPTVGAWATLAAVASFAVYGIGKSAMHTASQAIVPDSFSEKWRPIAASVLRATFVMGIILGSVLLGRLVDPYSPGRLQSVVVGTGLGAIVLAVLGNVGVEPRGSGVEELCCQVREVPFWTTLKRVVENPQARVFFFFVALILLSTLSQDLFMEPYGAEVFAMTVGETARLNMFWGGGTLVAMLLGGVGLAFAKTRGRKLVSALGLTLVALVFVGLILVGTRGTESHFRMLVLLLGVGGGLAGAGAMTLMMDFTSAEYAGLLMGAWTIAHQLAEAVGNAGGGVVVDRAYAASGSYVTAFGTLFGLEVVFALVGLALLARVDVTAFQETLSRPEGLEAVGVRPGG
jgi:BCD family chlorophyll transporter-like MFS transporter